MKRLLITGASGFVGRHLVRGAAAEGWAVRAVSRHPKPEKLLGVGGRDDVASTVDVDWHLADLLDPALDLEDLLSDCEAVVHLVTLPLGPSNAAPVDAVAANITTTARVLSAAAVARTRVVYTSTGQVYGRLAPLPNRETDPLAPDSVYAASKASAELWCQAFSASHGIDVQVLRLFNVLGPSVDGSPRPTVEALFLDRLRRGEPPIIHASPETGRDFIHVQDVVRAVLAAAITPGDGIPINVGSGRLTTLPELARRLGVLVGQPVEAIVREAEPTTRWQADTRRAEERLGFRARVTLEEGLRELVGVGGG